MLESEIILVSKYSIVPGFGISSKLFETAHFLSNHHKVTLITSNSNHLSSFPKSNDVINKLNVDLLEVLWLKTLQYKSSKSLLRILSWFDFELKLRKIRINSTNPPKLVVISSLSLFSILWGVKLKKKYGTRVIFEVRDIYPLTLTSELNVSKLNPMVLLMGMIEKYGYLNADLIVGTMPKFKDHVKNIIGYNKEVFYSPIGLSSYYTSSIDKVLIPYDVPENYSDSIIVGYSGSLGESNYLNSLIRVIKVLNENVGFYFVIVGSGDYLEKFKNDLKACKNVFFTGRVNPNIVNNYLISFDCLYLSVKPAIIWDYGQSMNKVLDYLMAGKPIIAAYDGYANMLNEIDGNITIPSNDDNALIAALEKIREYDSTILESIERNSTKLVKENYIYEVINKNYYTRIKELISS